MRRRTTPRLATIATSALSVLVLGALAAGPVVGASPAPSAPAARTIGAAHLLEDLARVPATADVTGDLVSWLDHRAVEDARPGAAHPATLAELLAGLDADDPAAERWMAAFMGAASGSSDLMSGFLGAGAEWGRAVGFDPMAIDRQLAFGTPPANGLVLAGRFAPDEIGAALGARDFSSSAADGGFTLWCGPAGCENGLQTDFKGMEAADPFGGRLGRKQPLAVSPSTLLSSADIATVDGMISASTGDAPSLAFDPDWSAAAGALAGEGTTLIQATIVPGSLLLIDPAAILSSDPSLADLKAWVAQLRDEGFRAIPPATLLAIGDAATGTEQVVTLALTYPTLADAQTAAEVIPERLGQMRSLRVQKTWTELLADRGVTSVEGAATETPAGGGVATITLRAPLAGDEPDDTGRLVTSSMLYRLFTQAVYARDTDFLAPDLPAVD